MSRKFGISPVRINIEDRIIYRVVLVRVVLVSCLQLRDYMVLKLNTDWEVIGLVISSSRRKGFVVVGLGFLKVFFSCRSYYGIYWEPAQSFKLNAR